MPVEPPESVWAFPECAGADAEGLIAAGADLAPGTLLAAYRHGMFPMPLKRNLIGWWSPDPRGVLPLDGLRVTRSMRRSVRRYRVAMNTAFREVMLQCADPTRPQGWISDDIVEAYTLLHELGWAHSVEVYDGDDLVGGLYGVKIERFFAGESMFHHARDASKVALVHLVEWLRAASVELLDVQWTTPHLRSLGAIDIPRDEYLARLAQAVTPR